MMNNMDSSLQPPVFQPLLDHRGIKTPGSEGRATRQHNQLAKCRITTPTVIRHTPPPFFNKAVKGAPQTQGARQGRAFPDSK